MKRMMFLSMPHSIKISPFFSHLLQTFLQKSVFGLPSFPVLLPDGTCLTNSMPIIKPSPRTSPMTEYFFCISFNLAREYLPTSSAFLRSSFFCIVSIVAMPAAHETGLPPNVVPCAPGDHFDMISFVD